MLELQSYDLANDEDTLPTHALTEAKWRGEQWHIGVGGSTSNVQSYSRAVVCQQADSPPLYLTYSAEIQSSIYRIGELNGDTNTAPFGLRMSFADAMRQGKWGRGLFLNEGLQLRQRGENARFFLFLSPHGWGLWRDLKGQSEAVMFVVGGGGEASGFIWSQTDEKTWLRSASPTQIRERIVAQFQDSNSDVAFSHRFVSLDYTQRRKLLWSCRRGDMDKMERVLHLLLLLQDEIWESATSAVWHIDLERRRHEDSYIDLSTGQEISIPELDAAYLQVFDFFEPQRADELIERHLCLQATHFGTLSIRIDSPSTHDRLEAALEWREWQNTNLG